MGRRLHLHRPQGNAVTLTAECAAKVAKMIPRLASDHDGEVVATVKAIVRVLESSGATLHDLAAAIEPRRAGDLYDDLRAAAAATMKQQRPAAPTRHGPPSRPADVTNHLYIIDIVRNLVDCDLSERERDFVEKLRAGARRQGANLRMTPKQAAWFESIIAHNGF